MVRGLLFASTAQLASGAHAQFSDPEWPKTDFSKTLVDLAEIQSGGPPKDGIPAIDHPRFVTPAQAAAWLDPREPVIVVALEGKARAYPLQILVWHEIVNDVLAGIPISVTFCPLCNATLVFDRRHEGRLLDFGTTGRLRKSDLVMYDRQTETWWQQFTGKAIVGTLAGSTLEQIPASIVAFEDFRRAHPDAEVLSKDTGHTRDYGSNPYAGYDDVDSHPFLFNDEVDPRLRAMERVLNITIGDIHRLYPFSTLAETPVINETVNGVDVAVFSRPGTLSALDRAVIAQSRTLPSATAWLRHVDGQRLDFRFRDGAIEDEQTGSRWSMLGVAQSGPLAGQQLTPAPSGVHFAFAWLAFYPQSTIYGR
jgi:hypothetical protein